MSTNNLIKVCGCKHPENIEAIAQLMPDIMGFIFYPKSQRFIENLEDVLHVPKYIKKCGVFVDQEIEYMVKIAKTVKLDIIQLHGDENSDVCLQLSDMGYKVIKAIPIRDQLNRLNVEKFIGVVDAFLFDTYTPLKGGSGQQFDWKILKNYDFKVPFFLSGGIGPDDIQQLKSFTHKNYCGIDINSRFELEPGIKDVSILSSFIHEFKSVQNESHSH